MTGYVFWKDRIWPLTCCFYAANRWGLKPRLPQGEVFFRGHFNDLLLIPCVLPPLVTLHRFVGLRRDDGPPRLTEVLTS
jgi:hypothetical protein